MGVRVPDSLRALLFDMDGVLTDTAVVHAAAWKEAFDAALDRLGIGPPFDEHADYLAHVDGRSRLDGVRAFLTSRGIALPEGGDADAPGELSVHGIGRAKNDRVVELIRSEGVDPYAGSADLVRVARGRGLATALVSSSANARDGLRSAGLENCFDAWVDGVRIAEEGIPGKPAPDTFLAAARDLGVEPAQAGVLEDAIAGVQAGRAGGFGWVVGVDRHGRADELREAGADVVVSDLAEIEFGA